MTAVFTTLAVIALQLTGAFTMLECAMLDHWFRLRPYEPIDKRIVIVTINEKDISHFRSWPIYDATLAKLLDKIKQQQPAVIGLDLYRNLPVEPGNQELLKVYESTPNLIGIQKVVSNANGPVVDPPPILGARNQVAACDLVLESDGKVRRYLLSIRVDRENRTYLTLGAKLALTYLETLNIKPISDGKEQALYLGKAKFLPLQDNEGGFVRADVGGYQILANFRNSQPGVTKIPVLDILENRVPPDLMQDKVVLVGSVAESFSEKFYTPYTHGINTAWSGVELHADLTSQILSAALDDRQLLRGISEPLGWLWILIWSNVGAFLGWEIRPKFGRKSQRRTQSNSLLLLITILLPSAIVTLGASTYSMFIAGYWVTLVSPLLGLVSAAFVSRSYLLLRSIQLSHQSLSNYAQTLELKVKERTQELMEKNIALEIARQEAESASIAKTSFLANVSHELRTPLNAILGFSQILARDEQLTLDQKQHIEIINRSGKHLLELINDVLSMSKIEAGRTILVEKTFDLYALLDSIHKMLQLRATSKSLEFKFEFVGNIPQYISADEGKLRQILINLLGNAIKFTTQGSVTLHVKLVEAQIPQLLTSQLASPLKSAQQPNTHTNQSHSAFDILRETVNQYFSTKQTVLPKNTSKNISIDKFTKRYKLFTIPQYRQLSKLQNLFSRKQQIADNNENNNNISQDMNEPTNFQRLVFEVTDTGSGIEYQDLDNLFNPFVQTQLGRQSMEGTGLGLAISREYVKLMGGDIEVSSVLNQGSTFCFDIKFNYAAHVLIEDVAPTYQITGLAKNQPSYRILIAEDVEENRLLLLKLLSPIGFEVRQAINGSEAVENWIRWRPHLILMDMRMPVMDGYEATQKIRELEQTENNRYSHYESPDNFQQQHPHTVIIALTASTFEEQKEEFIKAGCDAFVGKPVSEQLLYNQIAKYLNVKYTYAESTKHEPKINNNQQPLTLELHPDSLQIMSEEWIGKLHYAAISLNDESIIELIKDIPDTYASLAEALNHLVDNFRLDIIAQSIESYRDEQETQFL